MKILLGVLVAMVTSAPAFAFLLGHHYRQPVPVPAPDLAVGAPAVVAVIAAYAIARLAVRRRATAKVKAS